MIKRYKLFFTPTCPKCPAVKKYIKENLEMEGEFIDASKPEGIEEAKKHNVLQAPAVLFFNEKEEIECKCHTMEEIKKCLSESQD